VTKQVNTSLTSSFANLRPRADPVSASDTYLDCVLLHSPLATIDLTLEAWRELESFVPHRVRALGISNVPLPTLQALYSTARIKPSVVQNRFHARTRFEVDLRKYCRENGIIFQSFWTLTGNPEVLKSEPVVRLSREAGVSRESAMYALVMELGDGVAVLNGTTSEEHMIGDFKEVTNVKNWSFVYAGKWNEIVEGFRAIVEPS
jgi:diketogulonate reductase-like aldo/keto reductase